MSPIPDWRLAAERYVCSFPFTPQASFFVPQWSLTAQERVEFIHKAFTRTAADYFIRSSVIRTRDPMRPRHVLYQAELYSENPHWFAVQTKNGIYRHPRRDFVFTSDILRSFLLGRPYDCTEVEVRSFLDTQTLHLCKLSVHKPQIDFP